MPDRLCNDGQPRGLVSEISLHSFTGILWISCCPPESATPTGCLLAGTSSVVAGLIPAPPGSAGAGGVQECGLLEQICLNLVQPEPRKFS